MHIHRSAAIGFTHFEEDSHLGDESLQMDVPVDGRSPLDGVRFTSAGRDRDIDGFVISSNAAEHGHQPSPIVEMPITIARTVRFLCKYFNSAYFN